MLGGILSMKRLLLGCLLICAVSAIADDQSKPSSTNIYFCPDALRPCISDQAGGCSDCKEKIIEKEATIETLMKFLSKISDSMKKNIDELNAANLSKCSSTVAFIMQRVAGFTPPKSADKKDEFIRHTAELTAIANSITVDAEKNNIEAVKTSFRNFGNGCGACHRQFRKLL
jgi:cytochrome c556